MKKLACISIILLLSSCYLGEELPADQEVWQYASPSEVGLSDESLFELDTAIEEGRYDQINSLIMIKDDQLVFENYYNFGHRDELRTIGRITFPVLALALDLFITEGYIHLNKPIKTYLPEYENIFYGDSLKQLITIRDLLTFRSGLVWNETLGINNDLFRVKNEQDWTKYVLSKPMEAPPGHRLVINSGVGIVLAKIMQNQLGNEDLLDYLKSNLFSRIGIQQIAWEIDPQGVLNGMNGLSLSTRDLTRLGYLMLNEGRWLDRKRIISRDWVLDISSKKLGVDDYYSLGYSWWVFTESFASAFLLPDDRLSYFVSGESGQSLFVVPGQNMIVCISADNYNQNFINPSLYLFVKSLESLQPALAN